MIRIAKLFSGLFLLPALLFGIFWFIAVSALYYVVVPDGIVVKPPIIIIAVIAAAAGLLFGLCMAAFLGFLQFRRVRQVAGPNAPFDLSPIQSRTLELPMDLPEAFHLCARALENLPAKIAGENETTGVLWARRNRGRLSQGEDITITLAPTGQNTQITIISRPQTPTTLLDYGRGYENAEKIQSYLKSYS